MAVISHGLWQRQFGGVADIVGQDVGLSGQRFTVIGVTPEDFIGSRWPTRTDIYVPVGMYDAAIPQRAGFDWRNSRGHWLELIGRLADHTTIEAARAEMDTITAGLADEYPDTNRGVSALVMFEGRVASTRDSNLGLGIGSNMIDVGYVGTMGLTLLRGREFTRQDDEHGPSVAIVNEAAAERLWPGEDPIGRYFRSGHPASEPRQVVGLVRTAK